MISDLSKYLAIRLEECIQGGVEESPILVHLAHPVARAVAACEGPRAVLYLHRIVPSASWRQAGVRVQPSADPALPGRLSRGDLWLDLRFIFMIIEATSQEEMGAIAAAVEFLHRNALLSVAEIEKGLEKDLPLAIGELPVEVVDEPGAWRELGLDRHHLGVSFKVSLPVASRQFERVERVLERNVNLERVLKEEGE